MDLDFKLPMMRKGVSVKLRLVSLEAYQYVYVDVFSVVALTREVNAVKKARELQCDGPVLLFNKGRL